MIQDLKKSLVVGTIWSFYGHLGYIIITLVTNILLARIIGPQAFGQIGIIMFFIGISNVLTESGLGGALIRKQNITDTDYSTVFLFNIFISFLLFSIIFFSAGYISIYYNDEVLKILLRVSSLIIIINSFQFVNATRIQHQLNYKIKAKIDFFSLFVSSLISLSSAFFLDAGVWSVVLLQLITSFNITVFYWLYFGTLDKITFNITCFKSLYKFGLNTTIASIINTAFEDIYQLVLGKFFSIQQTGFYYQAKKLQEVPLRVVQSSTLGILYAVLSKLQDDPVQFDKMYKKTTSMFTIIVGFVCLCIFFFARDIILLLYGKEWLNSVFYIKILIVASFFYMQEMFNRILFKVYNRTDKILYLELIKKTIQVFSILIGIYFLRIEILIYGYLITSILSYFINYYVSRKVYNRFSWIEIFLVGKVLLIVAITILNGFLIKEFFNFEKYSSILMFPLLLSIYLFLVRLFRVSNIINDYIFIKGILFKEKS